MKHKDTQTILTAPAPEGFLEGSRADVSFAAGLLMDKFAWHLPLYRQHQRLAASGITVSRPWLTQLAQRSISLLEPIYQAQLVSIRVSRVKTMDETPIKAGRSGHGKMQTGYFWPVYGEEDEVCFPLPSLALGGFRRERLRPQSCGGLGPSDRRLRCLPALRREDRHYARPMLAAGGMHGDTLQDVDQVGIGIDAVQSTGHDQCSPVMKQHSEHLSFAGNGVTLAAERWLAGSSQDSKGVVFLLHGGGQTRHSWQNTGQRLAAEGSVPDGQPFAGGLKMGTPLGIIYATNITPDKETGIGNYTLAEFDNAVRRGVARDGRRLYPAMPYPSYAKLSDSDVKALYDYFMRGVQPVHQPNQKDELKWPFNLRWPLAFWNAVFLDDQPYRAKPAFDPVWNRGAYLVQGLGHCGSCHTPRGAAMQEKALDEGRGLYLSGAALDGWKASSLRGDLSTGLGRWAEQDIVEFLKNGRNIHATVYGSMMDAFNDSTQFMSDADLAAIARYLKTLAGHGAAVRRAREHHDSPERGRCQRGWLRFVSQTMRLLSRPRRQRARSITAAARWQPHRDRR
jgi:mono/diheme cytochrome c family protein